MTTNTSHLGGSGKPAAPKLEPRAGELVGGRYLLEREIAKGGMGVVWAGDDQKLRRPVALKLLTGNWANSEEARMRFEREAMAVAQLQCPNVVQVFDYGVERGIPFIVMELMSGEDLHKRLKRQRHLSLAQTTDLVWQVAKALGMAHGAGIVHRDLKPANVFLVDHGDETLVKVLDFGVAKMQDHSDEPKKPGALVGVPLHRMDAEGTKAGTLLGTPHFMSPEQARGSIQATDHRSDLWSLGVIAYRCLTGHLPFRGTVANDVIVKVCVEDPPPPSSVNPELSWEVDEFFERALSKNPSTRFQNAREMASALVNIGPLSMPSLRVPMPRRPISSQPMDSDIVPIDMGSLPEMTPPSLPAFEIPGPPSSDSMPSAAPISTSNRTFEAAIVDEPPSQPAKPRGKGRWLLVALALAAVGAAVWTMRGPLLDRLPVDHQQAAPAETSEPTAGEPMATQAPTSVDAAEPTALPDASAETEEPAAAASGTEEPASAPDGDERPASEAPRAQVTVRRQAPRQSRPKPAAKPAPAAKPSPGPDPFADRL